LLAELGLKAPVLAAAVRHGILLRLADGILLLPNAANDAVQLLSAIRQPFAVSEARAALGTSRRVTIPLLEHLDARGWTRRLADSLRTVVDLTEQQTHGGATG